MGKILFTSFESLDDIDTSSYQKKLHITRYINKGIKMDFVHVPQLAPSDELFKKTMYRWQKNKFTVEEKTKLKKGKTGTWFDLYEEEYLNEIGKRLEFQKVFNRLREVLDSGDNIIAVCYCKDYRCCHRAIIAELLKSYGYEVVLH